MSRDGMDRDADEVIATIAAGTAATVALQTIGPIISEKFWQVVAEARCALVDGALDDPRACTFIARMDALLSVTEELAAKQEAGAALDALRRET